MSDSFVSKTLASLTTTKGALLAAPIIVGAGLILSLTGTEAVQPQSAEKAQAAAKAAIRVAGEQKANDKPDNKPLQVAQAAPVTKGAPVKAQSVTAASTNKSAFTPEQRAEFGKLVREYLLANPEVIVEVSEELQRRQQAEQDKSRLKVLSSSKEEIFRSPLDYALGSGDTDVTIVEYFDYNCGWCKRALTEVTKLTKSDPKVRVVMKEFPIFGEHSEYAARAAMASKPQGKYWEFHVALMKERRVTKDNVMQIAARVGLDVDKLKAEMEDPKYAAAIQKNQQIATSLGIEGTPGFIIDSKVNPGYLPEAQLKTLIADIRKKGCQFC